MATLELYDPIQTDRTNPKASVYYSANASGELTYPQADTYNVMGPLYLPKIYGKDLTAFELASSGKIAVTLSDVYSFDLVRDTATNTVNFQTQQNDQLTLGSGSNAAVNIAGASSNVWITASNAISLLSAGSNASLVVGGAASNVDLHAKNNVTAIAKNDFHIWGSNVYINGNLMSSADSNSPLFFGTSNAYIKIKDSNMDIYTLNQVHFMMSNRSIYENRNEMELRTGRLSYVSSNQTDMTVGGAFNLTSIGTMTLSNSANLNIRASGGMDIESTGIAGASFTATGPMTLSTGNLLTVVNVGEAKTNTGSFLHNISHSNKQISDHIDFIASVNATYSSQSNVTNATNIVENAVQNHSTNASNVYITTAVNNTVFAGASNVLTSSNLTTTTAQDAQHLVGRSFFVTASNDATTVALQTIRNTANTLSNYAVTELNTITGNKSSFAGGFESNVVVGGFNQTSATASITALQNGSINFGSDFIVQSLSGLNSFNVNNASSIITATSGGNQTVIISPSNVLINGELRINGAINSVTTYVENVEIFDRTITLAAAGTPGASNFVDGPNNDGSGLIIAGFPSSDGINPDPTMSVSQYEKSIRLHVPSFDAMKHLYDPAITPNYPISAFDAEPYWEVKGGDLRMTLDKGQGHYTTFGWRIGAYDELELIKTWNGANGTGKKVVSKFGRSVNPLTGGLLAL